MPASNIQYIHVGDDHRLRIEGSGKVMLKSPNGARLSLANVLFVPSMAMNLLSIHMLISANNLKVFFDSTGCGLRDATSHALIACGIMKNGLYEFSMQSDPISQTHIASNMLQPAQYSMSITYLWLNRLGHVNAQKLKQLKKGDLYSHLPKFDAATGFFCKS